jgi:hypothetical protein
MTIKEVHFQNNNPTKLGWFSGDGSYLFPNGGKPMKGLSDNGFMWKVYVRALHKDNTVTCVVNDCTNTVWTHMKVKYLQELESNDPLLTRSCNCGCDNSLDVENLNLLKKTRSGRVYNKV